MVFLSCMNCWYNLEIKPLLAALFANIFCVKVVFAFSFAVQKLISLIKSYLFLLSFLLRWETDLRKPWYCFISENVLPIFSFTSFVVSCLIYLCYNLHFELFLRML